MKILITGSSGHISKLLVKKLINDFGDKIIILKRDNLQYVNDNIIYHDLSKSSFDIPTNINTIIHLASITPRSKSKDFSLNTIISKNLLKSIKTHGNIKKLINFSSIAIFNEVQNNKLIDEYTINFSDEPYATSKYKSEKILSKSKIQNIYNLRLPAVLVNEYSENLLTKIIRDINQGKDIFLYNPKNKFNNIISVDQLYDFIKNLLNYDYKSGNILLGSKNETSIEKIVNFLQKHFNKSKEIIWKTDNKGFHININKTIKEYNFEPKDTIQTIKDYVNKFF